MVRITSPVPTMPAIMPCRIESRPSDGPTVRSSQVGDAGRQGAGAQHGREVLDLFLG